MVELESDAAAGLEVKGVAAVGMAVKALSVKDNMPPATA